MSERAARTDAVLDRFAGLPYEWGRRDCLTIASAIAAALTGVPLPPGRIAFEYRWETLDDIVRSGLERYGTRTGWFRSVLLSHPHARELAEPSAAQPGDAEVIAGEIRVEGCKFPYRFDHDLNSTVAFLGSRGLITWIHVPPDRVMRLHKILPGCDQLMTVRFAEAPLPR